MSSFDHFRGSQICHLIGQVIHVVYCHITKRGGSLIDHFWTILERHLSGFLYNNQAIPCLHVYRLTLWIAPRIRKTNPIYAQIIWKSCEYFLHLDWISNNTMIGNYLWTTILFIFIPLNIFIDMRAMSAVLPNQDRIKDNVETIISTGWYLFRAAHTA